MSSRLLRTASETASPGREISGGTTSGLPADLLQEASKRLGWACLIYAATFFLAYFGPHLYLGALEGTGLEQYPILHGVQRLQTVVAVVSIALALVVFLLSRFGRIEPARLLDFGLIFEVVGAFGISMTTVWGIFPEWSGDILGGAGYLGIPWESVWIVIFPVVAPNTPGKTLLASLAAASTGLVVVLLSKAAGLTSPDAPMTFFAAYYLFTTYLCAGIAFVISRILYGFGRRLKRAREIGSYQLVKLLGAGGMGEVWMAQHRMLARPAAVKLIRPEALGPDESARKTAFRRFEREARATAALDSNHTITLYDFGITQEGAFYYVMELLKGLNLEEFVKRFGPVEPARSIYIMRQICHSLGEAHRCGMVHRDIKPANIYLCRLGPDYDFVKVLDFGLVKPCEDVDASGTDLTAEGLAAGTPAFMAPEVALGKADIDGRADIYALGCVGYWLLTGHRVFDVDGALATVVAHVQEKPVPPSRRTEIPIPESLEGVILTCLEKDPAGRPHNAAQLDAALSACALDTEWDSRRARDWWSIHMPDSQLEAACKPDADCSPKMILKTEL